MVYKEVRRQAQGRAVDDPFIQGHREPPSYLRMQRPLITSFSSKYYTGIETVRNRVGGRS